MKNKIKQILRVPIGLYLYWKYVKKTFVEIRNREKFGYIGKGVMLDPPLYFTDQTKVFLSDYTKLRQGFKLINNTGKFIVKKYSAIATNCTVVTGNHKPTVGVLHPFLGNYHINDVDRDVIIEEDVWVGANCTLLPGTHIGRTAVIGACSMVNSEIPPYAVAVGCPAKVIASVFTIDEIIEHEKLTYPVEERFSRSYLEQLFETHYQGKKSIGISTISSEDKVLLAKLMEQYQIKV